MPDTRTYSLFGQSSVHEAIEVALDQLGSGELQLHRVVALLNEATVQLCKTEAARRAAKDVSEDLREELFQRAIDCCRPGRIAWNDFFFRKIDDAVVDPSVVEDLRQAFINADEVMTRVAEDIELVFTSGSVNEARIRLYQMSCRFRVDALPLLVNSRFDELESFHLAQEDSRKPWVAVIDDAMAKEGLELARSANAE